MGLVDLHCHILWGLDDGCRSAGETLMAARTLALAGFSDAVPSPHAQARYRGGDARLAHQRLDDARSLLAREGVELDLHPGAENLLDDCLDEEGAGMRGLGDLGRYVLVEVPFRAPVPGLLDLLQRLRSRGLYPIVAHPERCQEFDRPERARQVVESGAALQLNLGALTGRHGRQARQISERLLDERLYAVAGTDLHAPDGASSWIGEALQALSERGGASLLQRLCDENPRRVLAGETLP